LRNIEVNNSVMISNNLGVTMNIGAGDKATGDYGNSGGVSCLPTPPASVASDGQVVKCVLLWYVHHPIKSARLVVNKSVFFWSPWSGPLASGTMARNPWLKMDPVQNIASTSGGRALVFGWFGKTISWIWLFGGLLFLCAGFGWLWKRGALEREISLLTATPIFLAALTSVGTIGDHRFRVPTMGLSLFLQVVGFSVLKDRLFRGTWAPTLETKARAR
jgi:hypothetical protein